MRTFILRAKKCRTDGQFELSDLSTNGYFQVVCQSFINAFWVSNNIRRDVIFHVVLEGPPTPPLCITIQGSNFPPGLDFSERSVAQFFKSILQKKEKSEFSAFIEIRKKSFESFLTECAPLYYLCMDGQDILNVESRDLADATFILGDNRGMPTKSESLLERRGAQAISLGPQMLFASQSVVVLHNVLDRLE
jgi:tRNA (pseudouridine54-N1)-methyltransferase